MRHNSAVNQLKMDLRQSIITLSGNGWSQRKIARELGINRETVARYRREHRQESLAKPATVPAGSSEASGRPTILPSDSATPGACQTEGRTKPPSATMLVVAEPVRKSQCEP